MERKRLKLIIELNYLQSDLFLRINNKDLENNLLMEINILFIGIIFYCQFYFRFKIVLN